MAKKVVTTFEPVPEGEARLFRMKQATRLDAVMQYWDANPRANRKQVMKATGAPYSEVATVQMLAKYSDNYTLGHYVHVQPAQTIHVDHAKVGNALANPVTAVEETRWPQTPMIEDELPWFKKPSWYARMRDMVLEGEHIALSGPPGIGKSTAVRALAAEMHQPLVHVSADVGLRRRDLTGSVELMNGSTQFVVAEYAAAAVYGWWVKVDEVNAAEPDALLFMNSQLEEPKRVNFHGRSYPVHDNFRCFVTYNPGLIGTKPLPQSFLDRFFPIKQEFPTRGQLRAMLEVHGGDGILASQLDALVEFGVKAWESHKAGNMRYQITPRRLQHAIKLIKLGEDVLTALRNATLSIVDNPAEVTALELVISRLVK